MTSDPTAETRTASLRAALVKYTPTNMLAETDDIAQLADDMTEWERTTNSQLERGDVAHWLWTMGGSLDHKKCHIDGDPYVNACEVCETYLRAVADLILAALDSLSAETEGTDGK